MESWALPQALPKRLTLAADEIHVVLIPADLQSAAGFESLEGVLSPGEREKIARLRTMEKRVEAVMSRGGLRHILGNVLGIAPEAVVIRAGQQGKPFVEGGAGSVHFNVSHTEGLVVVAMGRDQELGVDVENVRADVKIEEVARQCFAATEWAAIEAIGAGAPGNETERLLAFYRCWTRKEAVLKAMGGGIAAGLGRVVVPVGELTGAAIVEGWRVGELDVGPGRVAALASQRQGSLRYWSFGV